MEDKTLNGKPAKKCPNCKDGYMADASTLTEEDAPHSFKQGVEWFCTSCDTIVMKNGKVL